MTKYEQEIYSIVNAFPQHLTVEEIFHRVRERYPRVVLATIYNNVNRLWEAGLIRKVTVPGKPDRYDRVQPHDHLVCKRCGRLADTRFHDLTGQLREELGEDFLFYDLKVFYLCPQCRAELKAEQEKAARKEPPKPETEEKN